MTLQQIKGRRSVMVIAVDAEEKEKKRLESIGVIPGAELSVLADNGGPLLVAVGESRVAVERELAARVIVA